MAAAEEWCFEEEGRIQLNSRPLSITYSQTSNCFIYTLEDGSVEVVDVRSGSILKRTELEDKTERTPGSSLQCKFCPGVEKLFITSGAAVGLRKDLNGVLLLDSILQPSCGAENFDVLLELTLSDTKQLLDGVELCIASAVPPVLDALQSLQSQLKIGVDTALTAHGLQTSSCEDKSAKWSSCKFTLAASALPGALDFLVTTLHKSHLGSTALPVASALLARVMFLTQTSVTEKQGQPIYKPLMFVEAARRETFSSWPHMDYRWAYPEAMAQAGFYHQPSSTGDDRALCFTCNVCLVCWEPTDEPWSEHERHFPECPYVKGNFTENVPMAVTLATSPAYIHGDGQNQISCISESACSFLMATATSDGHVVVWNLSDQLKVHNEVHVRLPKANPQPPKTPPPLVAFEAWADENEKQAGDVEDSPTKPTTSQGDKPGEETKKNEDDEESEPDKQATPCQTPVEQNQAQQQQGSTKEEGHQNNNNNNNNVREGQLHVCVTALCILCSCPKEQVCQSRRFQPLQHKSVLITGVSLNKKQSREQNGQNLLCPQLLVYDVSQDLTEKSKKNSDIRDDPKTASTSDSKSLGMEYPYTYSPSGSEEDWFEPNPVILPDDLHSSVLQKFQQLAEAMVNKDEKIQESLDKSATGDTNKGNIIQSLRLPENLGRNCHWNVSQIVPCSDGHQILVLLKPESDLSEDRLSGVSQDSSITEEVIEGNKKPTNQKDLLHTFGSAIVVYRVVKKDAKLTIFPDPVGIKVFDAVDEFPTTLLGLPLDNVDIFDDEEVSCVSKCAALLSDGSLALVDTNSVQILARFTVGEGNLKERFVHVMHCQGADCLCVCTSSGKLCLVSIRHQSASRGQQHRKDESRNEDLIDSGPYTALTEPVTLQSLVGLAKLTEFENLVPRFAATVPPFWFEVQQDQQQRRHPQHLHQQSRGESTVHTRTWKLRREPNSVNNTEQVVELVLPRRCPVGHVELKYFLHSLTKKQAVVAYLLKPSKGPSAMGSRPRNHNRNGVIAAAKCQGTVICGPVDLRDGLDLSGQCGQVTLTSPELIKMKNRVLLLVIESSLESDQQNQEYLEEVSVTVRRFKDNSRPDCWQRRLGMLQDCAFHQQLIDICARTHEGGSITHGENEMTDVALKLLCWIEGTCMHVTQQGKDNLLVLLQSQLPDLVKACFLKSGRSIAHLCSRLLILCGRQATLADVQLEETPFKTALLEALLAVLPEAPSAVSSGAVFWFFKLLNCFAAHAGTTSANSVCLELLASLSEKLTSLTLPEHLLLRARHGLYGCPLEPVLFDVPPKQRSSASLSVPQDATTMGYFHRKLNVDVNQNQDAYTGGTSSLMTCQGLLEVEPLQFVCCSSSDGARVERSNFSVVGGAVTCSGHKTLSSAGASHQVPTVSASLMALEQELQVLKQQQQQLAKLQQHKQELEKHKKELEELAVWSLFPKLMSKYEGGGANAWPLLPGPGAGLNVTSGAGISINLAQEKKLGSRRQSQTASAMGSTTQHVLQLPQPQVLVIERLHSGARHHVLLDFGCLVKLTDVIIPRCADLTSLSVDVWTDSEETDARRVAVVSDISLSDCVLKDLLPPPICRYVKLTVIGRPRNNARVRMKIGEFYGRPLCCQSKLNGAGLEGSAGHPCMTVLQTFYDDVHCRYSLTCSQLRALLYAPSSDNGISSGAGFENNAEQDDESKINKTYQQCIKLQLQLNLIHQTVQRLSSAQGEILTATEEPSYDHYRVICHCLLDSLVVLTASRLPENSFLPAVMSVSPNQSRIEILDFSMCRGLFRNLCVNGNPHLRERASALLLQTCSGQPWWGEFLASSLKEFFSSKQGASFPRECVFAVLVTLSQKSPCVQDVLCSLLQLLDGLLSPDQTSCHQTGDASLLGWLLTLLAHVLDTCAVQSPAKAAGLSPPVEESTEPGTSSASAAGPSSRSRSSKVQSHEGSADVKPHKAGRWDFIVPTTVSQPVSQSVAKPSYHLQRRKLKKQIMHHQKLLAGVQQQQPQSFHQAASQIHFKQQAFKTIRDLMKRHQSDTKTTSKRDSEEGNSLSDVGTSAILLPFSTTAPVMQNMIALILDMDSMTTVDVFLITCKVLALLSWMSEPRVHLSHVTSEEQLSKLLKLCVSTIVTVPEWGGAWAQHALTCLIQDLLQGEKESKVENGHPVQESAPLESSTQESNNDSSSAEEQSDVYEESLDQQQLSTPGWASVFTGDSPEEMPHPIPLSKEKRVSSLQVQITPPPVKLSSIMDARLELGYEMVAERYLTMLDLIQGDAVAKGLSTKAQLVSSCPPRGQSAAQWSDDVPSPDVTSLNSCFSQLFSDCESSEIHACSLAELWLKLKASCAALHLAMSSVSPLLTRAANSRVCCSRMYNATLQLLKSFVEGQLMYKPSYRDQSELKNLLNNPDLLQFLLGFFIRSHVELKASHGDFRSTETFLSVLRSAVDSYHDTQLMALLHNLMLRLLLAVGSHGLSTGCDLAQMQPFIQACLALPADSLDYLDENTAVKLAQTTVALTLRYLRNKDSVTLSASGHFTPVPHSNASAAQEAAEAVGTEWLMQLFECVSSLLQVPDKKMEEPAQGVCETLPETEGTSSVDGANNETLPSKKDSGKLADKVLGRPGVLAELLECLELCSTYNIGFLLATPACLSVQRKPGSIEESVLQLLCTLRSQASDHVVLIEGMLNYLRSGLSAGESPKGLSEPLVQFLFRVLDSKVAVSKFYAQGGLDVLCQKMKKVGSKEVSLDDTSAVSLLSVMRHLSSAKTDRTMVGRSLVTAVMQAERNRGLVNYAPFGTVTCSDKSSTHAPDPLIRATAPHRRARSAAWSYHFAPDEDWCEITVHLATAILLWEVQINPHSAALATSPSYVTVDVIFDGSLVVPVCGPIPTSGLTLVKLRLREPCVAQHVRIRFRRPRDSHAVGLSQIQVLGTSLYGPQMDVPPGAAIGTQMASINWLRLLHHCLCRGPRLEQRVLNSPMWLVDVFDVCTSLLVSPHSGRFTSCIESVLLEVSLQCPDFGTKLISQLLGHRSSKSPARPSVVTPSTVQLIYQLGTTPDSAIQTRITTLAEWLESHTVSWSKPGGLSEARACTGHFQAISAVIWASAETESAPLVCSLFTESLFRSVYKWSQAVHLQETLKRSLDHIICALCHVCPPYFRTLLQLTKAQSFLDEHSTSESREPAETGRGRRPNVFSHSSRLTTLAAACQSSRTAKLLVDSALLDFLIKDICLLCSVLLQVHTYPTDPRDGSQSSDLAAGLWLFPEQLPHVLTFLAECAREPAVKDWFGEEGSSVWYSLLSVLCVSDIFSKAGLIRGSRNFSSHMRLATESATVDFISKCAQCHAGNQTRVARLVCDVIQGPSVGERSPARTINGFIRQLILQLLLQDEKIQVCLYNKGPSLQTATRTKNFFHENGWHPRFGAGHNFSLVTAKLSVPVSGLGGRVCVEGSPVKSVDSDDVKATKVKDDLYELAQYDGFDLLENLSFAAGMSVKSKRNDKDDSSAAGAGSEKNKLDSVHEECSSTVLHYHKLLPDGPISHLATVSQVMKALEDRGLPSGMSYLELTWEETTFGRGSSDSKQLLSGLPLTSPLEIFANLGGLAVLSGVQGLSEGSGSSSYLGSLPLPLPLLSSSVLSAVPAHSLVAFGLFLRLHGYADVLLRDKLKAQYLLRLLLGAEDDGDGAPILHSHVAQCLPTLPFQVLQFLFHSSPLDSPTSFLLRKQAVQIGAVHLLLACLAVLSHHEPRVSFEVDKIQNLAALTGSLSRSASQASASEKQYWAKGTGFGTGSTTSGWDIEQAMMKQRAEEEHVTYLLQVLSAYILPSGASSMDSGGAEKLLPSVPCALPELLTQSCLVPALSSYLRNDSVLDMSRHVPLYRAVMELLRAVALCPCLVPLLMPLSSGAPDVSVDAPTADSTSLSALLQKMKQCVDVYSKTLRSTRGKKPGSGKEKRPDVPTEEASEADTEGLSLLIPDIQETAELLKRVLDAYKSQQVGSPGASGESGDEGFVGAHAEALSKEERYIRLMKQLQFDTYEIVTEKENGKLEMNVGYHYASTLRSAASSGGAGSAARARRLAQEISSLASSLPLNYSSSVFVRCDEERLDIMKVLITGPAETPYANGCFEFDVYFPQNYPESPMNVNFETTGHHSVRFNPNLYNDGKVCLSILNTWHGRPEEKWNPQTSSFLQVLVSTQSLILVPEPYFNEPGYERSRGTPAGQQNSREYDANIQQATVKWAILEQLKNPSPCFKEAIQRHFYLKKDEVLAQCERWIVETEQLLTNRPVGRAVSHHVQSLKQNTAALRQELDKLKPPEDED